jgi:hypothetical protein
MVGRFAQRLIVSAFDEHGSDPGGGAGVDVPPPVADHATPSVEQQTEFCCRLLEHSRQRLSAGTTVIVIVWTHHGEIQTEGFDYPAVGVVNDVGSDLAASDVGLVGDEDEGIAASTKPGTAFDYTIQDHVRRCVAKSKRAAITHLGVDQGAVTIKEYGALQLRAPIRAGPVRHPAP